MCFQRYGVIFQLLLKTGIKMDRYRKVITGAISICIAPNKSFNHFLDNKEVNIFPLPTNAPF